MSNYYGISPAKIPQSLLESPFFTSSDCDTCSSKSTQSQVPHVVGRAVPNEPIHPTAPSTTHSSKSMKIWHVLVLSQILSNLQRFVTQELPQSEALYVIILCGTFSADFSCAAQNWSRLPASMAFCSEEFDSVGEELSPLQNLSLLTSFYHPLVLYQEKTTNDCCQFTFSITLRDLCESTPISLCCSTVGGTVYSATARWKLFPFPWLSPTLLTTSFQFCHILFEQRNSELYTLFITSVNVYLQSNINFPFRPP